MCCRCSFYVSKLMISKENQNVARSFMRLFRNTATSLNANLRISFKLVRLVLSRRYKDLSFLQDFLAEASLIWIHPRSRRSSLVQKGLTGGMRLTLLPKFTALNDSAFWSWCWVWISLYDFGRILYPSVRHNPQSSGYSHWMGFDCAKWCFRDSIFLR